MDPHLHVWIDPATGDGPRYTPVAWAKGCEPMKPGITYVCRHCGAQCRIEESVS
jgi:hypothetical protein